MEIKNKTTEVQFTDSPYQPWQKHNQFNISDIPAFLNENKECTIQYAGKLIIRVIKHLEFFEYTSLVQHTIDGFNLPRTLG